MSPAEQRSYVKDLASSRADIKRQLAERAEARDAYLAKKVEAAGGLDDSLDKKLYDAVKEQARAAGLEYEDGPAY
jgi:hypothetical protein